MTYVRDKASGAIINNDDSHYKAILAQRESQKQAQSLCNKMKELESELSDIKSLLVKVIDNRK